MQGSSRARLHLIRFALYPYNQLTCRVAIPSASRFYLFKQSHGGILIEVLLQERCDGP